MRCASILSERPWLVSEKTVPLRTFRSSAEIREPVSSDLGDGWRFASEWTFDHGDMASSGQTVVFAQQGDARKGCSERLGCPLFDGREMQIVLSSSCQFSCLRDYR
jgi:hypothetical protein